MLLNITRCTGQNPTTRCYPAPDVNSAWGWVFPYCLLLTAAAQFSDLFMYLPFLCWFLVKRNIQAHTHAQNKYTGFLHCNPHDSLVTITLIEK